MSKNKDKLYSDFNNVENKRKYIIPEELPEGAYGAPVGENEQVENKSSPWKNNQRHYQPYSNEDKTIHKTIQCNFPGAQPVDEEQ